MTEQNNSQRGLRFLVIGAALVIIIGGINQAQSVLVSFLVAVFLAILAAPPVLWLQRKRVPSGVAVLLVVTGMIIVLLIIVGLVGTSLNGFINAMPSYQQRIQEQVSTLKALLAKNGIWVTDKMLLENINPGEVMRLAVGMLGGLALRYRTLS